MRKAQVFYQLLVIIMTECKWYCSRCKEFVEEDEICWRDDFVAEAWGHPVYELTPFCACGDYLVLEEVEEDEESEEAEDEND